MGPVFAYPNYEKLIPNSATFNPFLLEFAALGHRGQHINDNLNQFGIDFENVNEIWANLCTDDSDGDGFTNGVELGDPGCSYVPGAAIGPALSDPTDSSSVPSNPGVLGPPYPPTIILLHGVGMIIAWVVLAPFGIAVATVMKKGDNAIWFKIHRAALVATVLLNIISFIIIIATGEGGDDEDEGFPPHFSTPHTGSGFAVLILAILQIAGGFLRVGGGKTKSQKRLLWEFAHQWLGRIIVIIAFFAVWTGLEIGFAYNSDGFEGTLMNVAVSVKSLKNCNIVLFIAKPEEYYLGFFSELAQSF